MNVKAEKLTLTYGKHEVLKNISFELNEPKIYGLLGRNGAGKTSLLSLLASFREATSGSITMNGEIPFENPNTMQQVVFVYPKEYKDESDNVILLLKGIKRYRPNFDMEYAEYLVDKFKLNHKKHVKKFSKGMQSAVNAIIGLASRAPITIFDEVYLGMDAPTRDIFYKELLEDQQNHPRIIILSTHLVSEMDYLFDEILILNQGEIILQEEFDSLVSRGVKITGNAEQVDEFVRNKKQIHIEQLGQTKAVTVYGALSDEERKNAFSNDLEIGPVSLHELFIHLTREED